MKYNFKGKPYVPFTRTTTIEGRPVVIEYGVWSNITNRIIGVCIGDDVISLFPTWATAASYADRMNVQAARNTRAINS